MGDRLARGRSAVPGRRAAPPPRAGGSSPVGVPLVASHLCGTSDRYAIRTRNLRATSRGARRAPLLVQRLLRRRDYTLARGPQGHVGAVTRLFEARNADRQSSEPTKPKPRFGATAGLETHKKPAFGRTSAPPTQRETRPREARPQVNLTHNLGYTTKPPRAPPPQPFDAAAPKDAAAAPTRKR